MGVLYHRYIILYPNMNFPWLQLQVIYAAGMAEYVFDKIVSLNILQLLKEELNQISCLLLLFSWETVFSSHSHLQTQ